MRPRLRAVKWSQYDMHHVLWEPRLGATAFLRALLRNLAALDPEPQGGRKSWLDWVRQVRPRDVPFLTRMLLRTQRMMRPEPTFASTRSPTQCRLARHAKRFVRNRTR